MQPCQLGFIVDDLPAAVARWKALLGVEPQIVEVSPHAIAQTRYRGREQPVTATLAFFRGGPMEIELIAPGPGPSVWREHLERHGRTPQHIGIRVADYEAAMRDAAARGWTELQTGHWPGGRYAYVDATAELGVVVEYLWSER